MINLRRILTVRETVYSKSITDSYKSTIFFKLPSPQICWDVRIINVYKNSLEILKQNVNVNYYLTHQSGQHAKYEASHLPLFLIHFHLNFIYSGDLNFSFTSALFIYLFISLYCPGNPMDRGAWWSTVHGVAKELDMA